MVCQKGENMKKQKDKIIIVNEDGEKVEIWKNKGYFGNVIQCLKKIISLTEPDYNMTIKQYVERIESVYRSIENMQV